MTIVCHHLFQMALSFGTSGAHHAFAIGTVDPEAGATADVVAQFLDAFFGVALAEVDGEHAAMLIAAKGCVFGIVIKNEQIARLGFQGDGWHLWTLDTPLFGALANLLLQLVGIGLAQTMAAGNDPQTAGVTRQRVEIKCHFDVADMGMPAIGMPASVAHIVVTIAARVVEAAPKQCREYVDRRAAKKVRRSDR